MPQGHEDGNKDKTQEAPDAKNEDPNASISPPVSYPQNVLLQQPSPTQSPPKRLRTASPGGSPIGTVAVTTSVPRAPVKNHASSTPQQQQQQQQLRNVALPKTGPVQAVQPSSPTVLGQQGGTSVRAISSTSLQSLAAALGIQGGGGGGQRSGSASEMLSFGLGLTGDLTQLLLTDSTVSSSINSCSIQTQPIVTASLPPGVVVTTDASLAVLGPEVANLFKQQISLSGAASPAAVPVPCDNITSVHSYSLASASSSSSPSSSPQKSETKHAAGPHGAPVSPRTPTKRPRTSPHQSGDGSAAAATRAVNFATEFIMCLTKLNKLIYNVPEHIANCLPAGNIKNPIPLPVSRPKKAKIEKAPVSEEILQKRRKLVLALAKKNDLLRRSYYNKQTEIWCLKNGCYYEFFDICKNPPAALVEQLKANLYSGDSEHELKMLQELVATQGLLPVSPVLTHQPSNTAAAKGQTSPNKPPPGAASSHSSLSPSRAIPSQNIGTLKNVGSSMAVASTTVTKAIKQPMMSPKFAAKHNSLSAVYDSSIGSQEEIVERAKQEAYVMQRIADLRKEGLWSSKRLPKVQEQPRNKAQWDYLLEEMAWLATDFAQEKKWKKAAAKKCSRMILKYFQEKEMRVEKAEKEMQTRLRRIASFMAKEIRNFWTNIEKLVEYKQQTWLDAKKKKVLDSHLNFIVDQTEKYSSWLTQGLNRKVIESSGTSGASSPSNSRRAYDNDGNFHPEEDSEEDDEGTIDKEEVAVDEDEEVKLLQEESTLPLEDLLETLPKEILEKPASLLDSDSSEESEESSCEETSETDLEKNGEKRKREDDDDDEFRVPSSEAEEADDDEETLLEQEEKEKDIDYTEELKELQEENELTIEELYKKYENAYASDFEMSDGEDGENEEDYDEESSQDEDEQSDLKSLGEVPDVDEKAETAGEQEQKPDMFSDKSPSKEINDIAATAERFQPKGNTLSTTEVCTKVPFLLKHQLREYQHIGLDWLNAMFEKKLNGILADEMGLGKTIQTIALLAHLACEKGNWGPHLIVVPTSVMLNWEMEFKKWCPGFKILTYYGSPKERKQKRIGWTKPNAFHVCITSYKLVVQDHQSFRRKKWVYLILDEAQNIKNFKSQRWQMLLNFQSTHRLLLTGTPLQNNLMELWSLMHFLMPNVFQSHKDFREWFVNPVTGMIEGNHEYNESLIKRLHKVLRPFLLRRLKSEVEKQLPKKYEHVLLCRLSKRQRYLYDDFMSQTKTKETLATGNFMSVINILMQLRKVCNHPNMFDPRPTVSPFMMSNLTYHTASIVWGALDYDPFRQVSLQALNCYLADIELCVTAFAAHRMKNFQLQPHMIENIENSVSDPVVLPAGKIKITVTGMQTLHQAGAALNAPLIRPLTTSSPHVQPHLTFSRPMAPLNATSPGSQRFMALPNQHPAPAVRPRMGNPVPAVAGQQVVGQTSPSAAEYTLQLLQQPSGGPPIAQLAPVGNQVVTSQPFTVQLPAGARMPLGFGRLVQTSSGQHLLITPSVATTNATTSTEMPSSVPSVTTAIAYSPVLQNSLPNSVPNATGASQNIATAAVLPQMQRTASAPVIPPIVSAITRPQNVSPIAALTSPVQQTYNKPIGRVAPLNVHPPTALSSSGVNATPTSSQVSASRTMQPPLKKPKLEIAANTRPQERKETGPFHLESLAARQAEAKREKMRLINKFNPLRCDPCPIYGADLIEAVTMTSDLRSVSRGGPHWRRAGYVNCLNAPLVHEQTRLLHHSTTHLRNIVHTPESCLESLLDVIKRFVFAIPAAMAPPIELHVSHPAPSKLNEKQMWIQEMNSQLSGPCSFLHPVTNNMTTQFPELRLIEYDCGKLQNLAKLLQQLKIGSHRVLIFTQMTRMLDILEQFLCYHGHTYLRLDGTTKVEQRQALMERFNADKKIFCFILSTRSGGIGVNLTGADTVIFYDSDWNPTMDAQAQDRCHRIGQTRDVHIYRLVSERTVEENILKKANQKRLLGDLAIEGGNFTTAFFKRNTLHEIFGLGGQTEESAKVSEVPMEGQSPETPEDPEKFSEAQLEQALGMAEEELDLVAAKIAKDEADAELAEFDESIPYDNDSRDNEEKSPAEEELDRLMEQLTPIERYAVRFYESLQEPVSLEQLKQAEEEIEAKKRDWELGRLKALQEEHERRSKRENFLSNEDPLLCYTKETVLNQVFVSINGLEEMPVWAPPTPPQDDNDLYIDYNMGLLYEQNAMPESQLPPVFVKKENKRMKLDPAVAGTSVAVVTTRKQKVRKDDINIPRSLFDRPTAAILKMRREAKLQKVRGLIGGVALHKSLPSFGLKQATAAAAVVVNKPAIDSQQDNPEWLVHEDWALLQVVQALQGLPLTLTVVQPAHVPNWDMCADIVNTISRMHRSPKQCRNRYESVIVPREEGKILYDTNPKKQKKTKGIYKTKNNRPMRTSQLYLQDNNSSFTSLCNVRFDCLITVTKRRAPVVKPWLTPTVKNPKHGSILVDAAINYDQPMTPVQVAAIRAERIAREKPKAQSAPVAATTTVVQVAEQQQIVPRIHGQQQQQQQQQQQTTVAVTGAANVIQQQQTVIASFAQAQQLQNAAIAALASSNLRASQRVNVSTASGGTTTMTVQEMVAAAAAAGQVRSLTTGAVTNNTSVAPAVVSVAGLTAVQLQAASQRLTTSALATTTVASSLTQLNPQVTAQRNLTQLAQIQSFRHSAALLRQREQQTLKQQQLKRLQAQAAAQQQQQQQQTAVAGKVVAGSTASATLPVVAAAQQRIAQQQAASIKQSVGRTMTEAEMAQLVKRQQQLQQQKHAQLTTAQILAQAQLQQQVQQQQQAQQQTTVTSALQTSMATLVKTVSAPSLGGTSSVAIPVSAVSAGGVNITLPQTKSVAGQTKGTTATITNQQLRQLQLQQQLLLQARKGSKVTSLSQLAKVQGKTGGLGASALSSPLNTIQVIQGAQATSQQAKSLQTAMTVHQLQQAMKQVLPQSIPVQTSTTHGASTTGVTAITQSQILSQHAVLSAAAAAAAMKPGTTVSLAAHPSSVTIATTVATLQTLTAASAAPGTRIIPVSTTNANTSSAQAIKQAIQVVSATPTLSATLQSQTGLRGEPSVAGTVKSQVSSLPSTTLTSTSMLKGTSTVVVGQQQTAALLQQVAASSAAGLPSHHAVTLAVRAAASQAQGQQQVQIQVQPSPHGSLVAQQSIQSTQARIQQMPIGQASINIAQTVPVQTGTAQTGSITALSADSTLQQPTHVVMQNVTPANTQSASTITMPAALSPASATAQVVQAAIQAARQQQQQQQQQNKASPYTMRLRNPPK